jgi:hypothetical protein
MNSMRGLNEKKRATVGRGGSLKTCTAHSDAVRKQWSRNTCRRAQKKRNLCNPSWALVRSHLNTFPSLPSCKSSEGPKVSQKSFPRQRATTRPSLAAEELPCSRHSKKKKKMNMLASVTNWFSTHKYTHTKKKGNTARTKIAQSGQWR